MNSMSAMNADQMWLLLRPLWLELAVLAWGLVVLIADLLLEGDQKRGLGSLAAMGLAGILAVSFVTDFAGTAWGGAYVADDLGRYLKQAKVKATYHRRGGLYIGRMWARAAASRRPAPRPPTPARANGKPSGFPRRGR